MKATTMGSGQTCSMGWVGISFSLHRMATPSAMETMRTEWKMRPLLADESSSGCCKGGSFRGVRFRLSLTLHRVTTSSAMESVGPKWKMGSFGAVKSSSWARQAWSFGGMGFRSSLSLHRVTTSKAVKSMISTRKVNNMGIVETVMTSNDVLTLWWPWYRLRLGFSSADAVSSCATE